MSSTKGKLLRLLSGVLLQRGVVVAVRDLGGFRRIDLRAELPPFAAGAKVQVLLATDDARTYTPIPSPEGLVLVGWKQASGPGARWVSSVAVGDVVRFLGPQRSLSVGPGPVVVVGDETSVGVAAALGAERVGQAHAVIQSGAGADVLAAARAVGFTHVDVVPPGDLGATLARVTSRLAATPGASVALTGGSPLVVAMRDALRRAGVGAVTTKPYWIPGRSGLD